MIYIVAAIGVASGVVIGIDVVVMVVMYIAVVGLVARIIMGASTQTPSNQNTAHSTHLLFCKKSRTPPVVNICHVIFLSHVALTSCSTCGHCWEQLLRE